MVIQHRARAPKILSSWVFLNKKDAKWVDKVRDKHKTLGSICSKIAQGLVSGCDGAFYVYHSGKVISSKLTGKKHEIEPGLIHTLLKGSVHV